MIPIFIKKKDEEQDYVEVKGSHIFLITFGCILLGASLVFILFGGPYY